MFFVYSKTNLPSGRIVAAEYEEIAGSDSARSGFDGWANRAGFTKFVGTPHRPAWASPDGRVAVSFIACCTDKEMASFGAACIYSAAIAAAEAMIGG